jgi:hypothetical protein
MAFKSGAGDCEDYAIAKYAVLIQLGVPSDDLRLLVVYDRDSLENHAVTALRFEQRWLILDNRTIDIKGPCPGHQLESALHSWRSDVCGQMARAMAEESNSE